MFALLLACKLQLINIALFNLTDMMFALPLACKLQFMTIAFV